MNTHGRGRLVAPLTWGGIIGNVFGEPMGVREQQLVAPLTWGGIIGNVNGFQFL